MKYILGIVLGIVVLIAVLFGIFKFVVQPRQGATVKAGSPGPAAAAQPTAAPVDKDAQRIAAGAGAITAVGELIGAFRGPGTPTDGNPYGITSMTGI